jgi:hypothetical protein
MGRPARGSRTRLDVHHVLKGAQGGPDCQGVTRWSGATQPDPLGRHHILKRAPGGSDFDLDRLVALCRFLP